MMKSREKYIFLQEYIKKLGSLAVAFSGGVDSTFLLKAAVEALPEPGKVIAVTVQTPFVPHREIDDASGFAMGLGIKHIIIEEDNLEKEYFVNNPEDRCYYCKKDIFNMIIKMAADYGIEYVADGSNIDDMGDYRPGMKALKELGVVSPLKEAGLTKEEIRYLSRDLSLPTWDKPAYACLASRIPYGHRIDKKKLEMIDRAEEYLFSLGFKQLRVRCHEELARLEVPSEERARFFDAGFMDMVHDELRKIGFRYTALDLKGYRTGSLNEAITK